MKLHDYQQVARSFLQGRDRGALFLEMGLGKTACALTALEDRHLPALVIAPKRVAEHVWPAETEKWRPDLTVTLAAGGPKAREELLRAETDLVVLGRDNQRDLEQIRREKPFRTLILDEMSGYKSRTSIRWKTARKFINDRENPVPYVWGLTGTPSPNGLLDLWPQVALLDNGARLGKNITTYRNRFFVPGHQLPNGVITEWVLRPEADDRIHELIGDICLSMSTEDRVDVPPLTFNRVDVDLPPGAKRAYRELQRDLIVDLRELFDGEVHTAGNAAILTSRLSQITAGFMYVDDAEINNYRYTRIHAAKIDALKEIIEGTGSPVLVFYRFRAEKEMLLAALGDIAHTLDEPDIIKRWNRGDVPVLLAHPASAGHGLNLQYGGHTIAWTSLPWSLEEWEQANRRLARQGQTHPVVVHDISAVGSVDRVVAAALEDKTLVQKKLLDYLESPL